MSIPRELIDTLVKTIDTANESAVIYRRLTSGKSEAITHVLNVSDDAKIAEFRTWRDKMLADIEKAQKMLAEATESISEYAESLVKTDEDPETVKTSYLDARAAATKMRAGLVGFFGEEAVAKMYQDEGIEEITSLRGTKSKGATGIKRPRLQSATVNGEDVTDKNGKVSFTVLAAHVSSKFGKVISKDLRDAAFTAAGTDDLSTKGGEVIEYTFTVPGIGPDGKGQDIRVSVTPKVSEATDNEAAEDSEDEADED